MVKWLGTRPRFPAGHCQFCGYNLCSIQGEFCPECDKSRFAWVEAECEECHRVAVFAYEDAGKVNSCPFCDGAIDVPPPKDSSRSPRDSITKSRFSVIAFITVSGFVSFLSAVALTICYGVGLWLVGCKSVPCFAFLPPIVGGVLLGVFVAYRYSYR
jgi:hypothetical protein